MVFPSLREDLKYLNWKVKKINIKSFAYLNKARFFFLPFFGDATLVLKNIESFKFKDYNGKILIRDLYKIIL